MPLSSPEELKQAASSIPSSQSLEESLCRLRATLGGADGYLRLSLDEIASGLATEDCLGKRENLLALLACLSSRSAHVEEAKLGRAGSADGDAADVEQDPAAAARTIADFAARSISPIVVAPEDEIEGYHPTVADRERDASDLAERLRPLASLSLEILKSLLPAHAPSPESLITAVAFADPEFPCTTADTARRARELLDAVLAGEGVGEGCKKKDAFCADDVLRDYLRPLFSRSRPAAVTASGRRAEFAEEIGAHGGLALETREAKPWKHQDLRAVPVFSWALAEADERLVSTHWPLVTPVLLTLLDDGDTDVRSRGLRLLSVFLSKMDGATLAATGLDSIFRDAVFPTLLFVPSVTPEPESLRLQEPAYAALIALSRVGRGAKNGNNRLLLDKILRDGVLAAFFYAREYIRIVEVLARQAGLIVDEMKIHAVKHLKDLIPMISSIMQEPFAMAHPPSLLAAIGALQAVIRNCWARLGRPPWREEIIKALVGCWLRAREDDRGPASDGVCAELARTAEMLAAVTRAAGTDLSELVAPLTAKEPLLAGLL